MSRTDFLNYVRETVWREQLFSSGDSVLVGLSGGADSVALLRVLLELREEYGLTIVAAHVNHGLRGAYARRDMMFSEALCTEFGVPFVCLQEDVKSYAKEHKLSVEDAGRQVRYAFFKRQGTDKIAVAHTKDDNAETVLMNLIKGNLPLGIAPRREKIVRPLLGVTKEEIYTYLDYLGQDYVTDETNFQKDYTRNKVRLDFIPYIEENFNTNFINTVYHSADVLYREQQFLKELTEVFYQNNVHEETDLLSVPIAHCLREHEVIIKRALRKMYYQICPSGERISYEHIEQVFHLIGSLQRGKQVSLPGKVVALLSGDCLVMKKVQLQENQSIVVEVGISVYHPCSEGCILLSQNKSESARLCYPIRVGEKDVVTVRTRCRGDKLYFHNQNIHKKLSDFFIDKKIPLHERDKIPLVCVNDTVRVVVGHFYEEVKDCPQEEQYYITIE